MISSLHALTADESESIADYLEAAPKARQLRFGDEWAPDGYV